MLEGYGGAEDALSWQPLTTLRGPLTGPAVTLAAHDEADRGALARVGLTEVPAGYKLLTCVSSGV